MKKTVAVAFLIIFLLDITAGVMFYLICDLQTRNSALEDQKDQLVAQKITVESHFDDLELRTVDLQNRLDNLKSQLGVSLVAITDFTLNEVDAVSGITYYTGRVAVQNSGSVDVEGLKVVFGVRYSVTGTGMSEFVTLELGTVKAGETRTVNANIEYSSGGGAIVASLRMGDTVIDERSVVV